MALDGLRHRDGNPAAPPYNKGPYDMSEEMRFNGRVDLSADFDRYTLDENFAKLPQLNATIDGVYTGEVVRNCNTDFEILGTSASDLDVTFSTTIAGIQLHQFCTQRKEEIFIIFSIKKAFGAYFLNQKRDLLWTMYLKIYGQCVTRR